ncbi:MAG: TM2 domain-containing protein, partial [Oscillospiraceae bacterium]|nr:TM2 domain-containing protein [Oscillospiraceae bacterium]
MDKNKTILHAWLDFWLCFFLGGLGVHKFREGKIVWGLVYLFTFGLFTFGWTCDCITYFYVAFRATLETFSTKDNPPYTTDQKAIHMRTGKIIGLSLIIAWMLLLAGISACTAVFSCNPQQSSVSSESVSEISESESEQDSSPEDADSQQSSEEESESSDTSEPE